ncbi:RNA polymerase sigma-70 factor [Polaribacter sp. Z014]|uniref:RNA polymerase sigma-70 factor n=1 Tax=Polaribacter sp. Z014 TaxID=2927126 RepID=UPI0020210DBF|nr:RNA polymerase sigma-70 factor [Polaribacter sp. Z014]
MNLKTEKTKRLKKYNELYNSLYTSLCLFSNKYIDDLEKSKDIVQDVFIKFWNTTITFENEVAVKSYLYVCVKNKSLDYLKSNEYKLTERVASFDFVQLESELYFDKEFFFEEVSVAIEKGLKMLPPKCREIVDLSINGYKNNQISEELGISINTVKTQKKIAYQKLRSILKTPYIEIIAILLLNN